ncbi:latent transforming growth factor beta-binding protein [Sorangium sp. So ce1078]|uniref:latent transforming growth factor beta-binding protein n=1 Tax=Sorangium sp. So ce1078 TaxID=3133329 RepID=UPI003F61CAE6
MRVRHVMITAALVSSFAACASSDRGEGDPPVYATVCEARCACEDCSGDSDGLCEAEQEAIEKQAEERCQDQHAAYVDCVRLEGRCVDGHHLAEVCNVHAAALLGCLEPSDRDHCPSAGDGICDEPQGTDTCPVGTDPADCLSFCPYTGNGICDEPENTGRCPAGTDVDDCKLVPCASVQDGTCDEPEGTGHCDEGTDVLDCTVMTCSEANNGVCDEPEGTGLCDEGTDAADCPAGEPCPTTNDGVCDEPEGTGGCDEGSDVADCTIAPVACDDIAVCGNDTSGCIACANEGSCADELQACTISDDCFFLTQCMVTCASDACVDECLDAYPDGLETYYNYDTCVNCEQCYYSCGASGAFEC